MNGTNEEIPVLIAYNGPLDGQKWAITHEIIIGRDTDCDITIPKRQVSRKHARIFVEGKDTYIQDLGSKNGTHNNGKRIESPTILTDGDIIQIALAQQFVYLTTEATLPLEFAPSGKEEFALRINAKSRRVWVRNQEILPPLSAPQFHLLYLLYSNKGNVVSRQEIISKVWADDDSFGVSEQALDALVRRLRNRIASVDPEHTYIITIRGHGLRLDNPRIP